MADQAILCRSELAQLLATTDGAISQMAFKGELPATAFPEKRRACWFVGDIRKWLEEKNVAYQSVTDTSRFTSSKESRSGRPRSE